MNQNSGVSVVIPIYGDFDIKRILVSIESIKSQKEVDIEIVVSEQGIERRFPEIDQVKYIFTYHKTSKEISDFNPGKVRNIAIMNSTKQYIYTIDADVVLSDPLFLKKSLDYLKKNPNLILYRPFMRRLPKDNFEDFYNIFSSQKFTNALNNLIINQDFLVKTSPEYRELKIFEKISKEAGYKKTFTSLMEDYNKYIEERLGSDTEFNFWPVYWNENRHCGSNLFRIDQFLEVGGYSEQFINWGCEDSDLQWKFRENYNLQFFPEELEVIHLDHPKGYLSPKMWDENEKKSTIRKNIGIKDVIKEDRTYLNVNYIKQ
jgi:predicted glycosyltransferase involved in capsule biosynthesis